MTEGILVIGSINHDSVYRVEHLPAAHETIRAHQFVTAPGGKGSNQAVACARVAQRSVRMLACVGADMHAAVCCAYLRENGVDVSSVLTLDDRPTGTACITVEASGHNMIVVSAGANDGLTVSHVGRARALFEASRSVLLQLEIPLASVGASLQMARSLGKVTILNPAPYVAGVEAFLGLCDVFTPNQTEAASLVGERVEDVRSATQAASRLLSMGAGSTVITLGRHGALVATQTKTRHLPPYEVFPVIDTSGAGDVFNGALSAVLADGANLFEAADFAAAAAALSVQKPTASHCAPDRTETRALQSH